MLTRLLSFEGWVNPIRREDVVLTQSALSSQNGVKQEDPLEFLPCSSVQEFRKGQKIYDHYQSAASLYLVIDGKVNVTRLVGDTQQVLVDIYFSDDFFGEISLVSSQGYAEEATALENTKVMSWTSAEVLSIINKQPRLGVALLQVSITRGRRFTERIESLATAQIAVRIAQALIYFAGRMGHQEKDGSVSMIPMTHGLISQYVGTSREVVTQHMNKFRRLGYLRYSRKSILLYKQALQELLQKNGVD